MDKFIMQEKNGRCVIGVDKTIIENSERDLHKIKSDLELNKSRYDEDEYKLFHSYITSLIEGNIFNTLMTKDMIVNLLGLDDDVDVLSLIN